MHTTGKDQMPTGCSERQTIYDLLYHGSLSRAQYKVWILSDLQQGNPENTRRCLETGIADFEMLHCPAEQIWYLGDAVEGADRDRLLAMCDLQEKAFAALGLPLCYATGNHDYDYSRQHRGLPAWMPFYEMVRDHPGWKTAATCTDFFFRTEIGPYPVYFFCDHILHRRRCAGAAQVYGAGKRGDHHLRPLRLFRLQPRSRADGQVASAAGERAHTLLRPLPHRRLGLGQKGYLAPNMLGRLARHTADRRIQLRKHPRRALPQRSFAPLRGWQHGRFLPRS